MQPRLNRHFEYGGRNDLPFNVIISTERYKLEREVRQEQERQKQEREQMIKKKIDRFFKELALSIKGIINALVEIINFFRNSIIKKIRGGGGENIFCRLLKNIRKVLDNMISHLENTSTVSSFTKFKALTFTFNGYSKELMSHIDDAKKQLEEHLLNSKLQKNTLNYIELGVAAKAGKQIKKAVVSQEGKSVLDKLKTLYSASPVDFIIVIAVGLFSVGFVCAQNKYLQGTIDKHEKLYKQLNELRILLSSIENRIPSNVENYKTDTCMSKEASGLIEQLKDYEKRIGEFQDLFCSNC